LIRLKTRYSSTPHGEQIQGRRGQVRCRREKVDLTEELANYLGGKG